MKPNVVSTGIDLSSNSSPNDLSVCPCQDELSDTIADFDEMLEDRTPPESVPADGILQENSDDRTAAAQPKSGEQHETGEDFLPDAGAPTTAQEHSTTQEDAVAGETGKRELPEDGAADTRPLSPLQDERAEEPEEIGFERAEVQRETDPPVQSSPVVLHGFPGPNPSKTNSSLPVLPETLLPTQTVPSDVVSTETLAEPADRLPPPNNPREESARLPVAALTDQNSNEQQVFDNQQTPTTHPGPETEPTDVPQRAAETSAGFASDQDGTNQDTDGNTPSAASLGDSILNSLQRESITANASDQPSAPARLTELVDQVVERILVADEATDVKPEVRMMLKDSLLPETEVVLSRDGAALQVRFLTRSEDAAQWLSVHQQSLQEQLSNNLQCQVSVDVSGEQQDGRSRGQRDAYDEMESED